MKKIIIVTAVIVVGAIVWSGSGSSAPLGEELRAADVTVYKTSSCGCCGVYGKYLHGQGVTMDTSDVLSEDLREMSHEHGVPHDLSSCHISMAGEYFMEGHIPLEAIEKLLEEEPDIAGITLPGMPSGTPGMPGPKTGDWVIYSVGHDGEVSEFMTI